MRVSNGFQTSTCGNFRYFTSLHELFAQIFGGLSSRRNVQLPESYRLLSDSRLKQHGLKYFTSSFSANVPWNLSLASCNVSFRGIFCFLESLVSCNVYFLESFVSWNLFLGIASFSQCLFLRIFPVSWNLFSCNLVFSWIVLIVISCVYVFRTEQGECEVGLLS